MDTPSLKLLAFVAAPERCQALGKALEDIVPLEEMQWLGHGVAVVYTPLSLATLRDQLRERLSANESVLVVTCEQWSGAGPAVDSEWLLWRGH